MINLTFDLSVLAVEAEENKTNILRYLFDTHIYKHLSREEFKRYAKGHNYGMVQIADHGLSHINVRIKTKGVNETID